MLQTFLQLLVHRRNILLFDYQYSDYKFEVLTPDDLKRDYIHGRFQNSYDTNNPKDINEVICNVEGNSLLYQFPTGYETRSLNMQTIRNIYIRSSMGNYNSIGPKGESTIIKKEVPVNANKGGYIFDQVMTGNDFGDCSNQTLRTIKFDLKDSKGNHITLHGNHFSFSIIFSRMDKSIQNI